MDRTFTLDEPKHLRYRILRWGRDQHLHMIRQQMVEAEAETDTEDEEDTPPRQKKPKPRKCYGNGLAGFPERLPT